ncbi:tetratricopeptide repeat protein [Ascidiimonas aurantiaca]|uniref:tetratricopeptide repeat protein n=1 Tax=Ascidiimonas aurantiaca TaxID=1685432 RepID=UPI0030EBE50C
MILFATNTSTREASRIPYEIEKMLFKSNYTPKPISKNEIVQLLMFAENYSGDMKNLGKALQSNFGDTLKTPVPLNRLSGVYLREKQIDKAIAIGKLNIELFPNDGNIWDTMGDIYFNAKQNDKAIESYEKALKLKPEESDCFWCENSQNQLKILK